MSTVAEAATIYMLLTLSSLGIGAAVGLVAFLLLFLYRKRWEKKLRDRLARDGVTAEEIPWFMPELTTAERRALKAIDEQDPLLADAYRETLAARLTATRVVASSTKNLLLVERRLNRAAYIRDADTSALQQELREDRARLSEMKEKGAKRRAEAEARLQMIEAAASRGESWAETNFAMQRLEATQDHLPLALESARLEQQAREDVARALGEGDRRALPDRR
jgi:PHD/YefM family antitoxin component YafN of YafNO toxin-antitoxin module